MAMATDGRPGPEVAPPSQAPGPSRLGGRLAGGDDHRPFCRAAATTRAVSGPARRPNGRLNALTSRAAQYCRCAAAAARDSAAPARIVASGESAAYCSGNSAVPARPSNGSSPAANGPVRARLLPMRRRHATPANGVMKAAVAPRPQ
jgi:hypothetical protein